MTSEQKTTEKLDIKLWYRLLKVIYIFCFIVIIIITAIGAMIIKPSHYLLLDSSGFECPNKTKFTWKDLHGNYYYPGNSYLDMRDHFSALYSCELIDMSFNDATWDNVKYMSDKKIKSHLQKVYFNNPFESKQPSYIFLQQIDYATNNRTNPPYKLNWISNKITIQERIEFLFKVVLFFIILQIILDTIKNAIMYILTGKKFSYLIIDIFK